MIKTHRVTTAEEGIKVAKKILYQSSNKKTVLFLSGGKTPKNLYEQLAREKKLKIGAVGMVDERYGKKYHENSNEFMVKESGFLQYLESKAVPFFPILKEGLDRKETAKKYEESVRFLLSEFSQSIAILGMGSDGHTAGIPSRINDEQLTMNNSSLATEFDDFPSPQRERITLTFEGLSKIDFLILMVFGEDKKEALEKMMQEGSETEIPARFFMRPKIAPKTLLITDQKI